MHFHKYIENVPWINCLRCVWSNKSVTLTKRLKPFSEINSFCVSHQTMPHCSSWRTFMLTSLTLYFLQPFRFQKFRRELLSSSLSGANTGVYLVSKSPKVINKLAEVEATEASRALCFPQRKSDETWFLQGKVFRGSDTKRLFLTTRNRSRRRTLNEHYMNCYEECWPPQQAFGKVQVCKRAGFGPERSLYWATTTSSVSIISHREVWM